MTSQIPTYEVFIGESLPDLGLFIRENGALISGLANGHTFELRVGTIAGAVLFTKTTGFTGQAGSGFSPLGIPNLIIQWGVTGELDQLTEGTFRARLEITRTSDSRKRYFEWLIRARSVL